MNEEVKQRWHVGREISLSFVATIVVQTALGVWWAASMSSELSYIKRDVGQVSTQVQAVVNLNADVQRGADRNLEQDRRINDLEARTRELERALGKRER